MKLFADLWKWLSAILGKKDERTPHIEVKPKPNPQQPSTEEETQEPSPSDNETGSEKVLPLIDYDNPPFEIDERWMIPLNPGQAIGSGWRYSNPLVGKNSAFGVTWHWTATWNRSACDRILGGDDAMRKGEASAHYCVGVDFAEGISRYVGLNDRSWHAGKNQMMRWDGADIHKDGILGSGSRTTVGVETVNIGFSRTGIDKKDDWKEAWSPNGKNQMWVPPWSAEQTVMMIWVGKEIQQTFPYLTARDHHGHHDICPGYKEDPSFIFPFAQVLNGVYSHDITDVWTPFELIEPRQRALLLLGYDFGEWGADGDWGRISDAALTKFQKDRQITENGLWTTFVCWEIFDALSEVNLTLEDVLRG